MLNENSKALYFHCVGHQLNLVCQDACNEFPLVSQVIFFFLVGFFLCFWVTVNFTACLPLTEYQYGFLEYRCLFQSVFFFFWKKKEKSLVLQFFLFFLLVLFHFSVFAFTTSCFHCRLPGHSVSRLRISLLLYSMFCLPRLFLFVATLQSAA